MMIVVNCNIFLTVPHFLLYLFAFVGLGFTFANSRDIDILSYEPYSILKRLVYFSKAIENYLVYLTRMIKLVIRSNLLGLFSFDKNYDCSSVVPFNSHIPER